MRSYSLIQLQFRKHCWSIICMSALMLTPQYSMAEKSMDDAHSICFDSAYIHFTWQLFQCSKTPETLQQEIACSKVRTKRITEDAALKLIGRTSVKSLCQAYRASDIAKIKTSATFGWTAGKIKARKDYQASLKN